MGNGEKVLIIGRHAFMMERVKKLLTENNYCAMGAQQNKEAVELFESEQPQAVIIGGGIDDESRKFFHDEFLKKNPSVKIIDAHPQTVLQDLQKAFSNHKQ